MYKIWILNRFIPLYIVVWLKLRKFRYNIAIERFCSSQSRKMFGLIDYAGFSVRNEGSRTDADAKNKIFKQNFK